ncbi:MAG: HDOD domain-containing protein [Pseudomonadota bacterium]
MTTATQTPPEQHDSAAINAAAFDFIQSLTEDLNRNSIELPSFPDIAMKVKRVLEDENTSAATIARVVSSEPGLASRVLKMANSAANQRGGNAILDVPRAIGRLGHTAIRTLATSYAMQNMMQKRQQRALKMFFNELWNHSVHVAALSRSLAKHCSKVDPDQAMFVGLIYQVGKLYILTKVEDYPALFDNQESVREILEDWYLAISESILENWEFAPQLIRAVSSQKEECLPHDGTASLSDVLRASITICNQLEARTIADFDFENDMSARHVDLTAARFEQIMQDSKEEIDAMMAALNG